jgi:uncharacterized protein HemX
VAELLPVAGQTGALYALTMASRQPLAVGTAPVIVESVPVVATVASSNGLATTTLAAWVVAALAALALGYALVSDLRSKATKPATTSLALRRQSASQR